jgi:microcystin-dependent protein
MSNPFVAEIRIVSFNFAPVGWAFCDGQLLPISQNTALFSLLGTQYGGDGKTTFALPNLQGVGAMQTDVFGGGGLYPIGASGGTETVTLLSSEMPVHGHTGIIAASTAGRINLPGTTVCLGPTGRGAEPAYAPTSNSSTSPTATSLAGSSQPHNNLMPYLILNYIIALQGVFPPRS